MFKNATELLNFSKSEEENIEKIVKDIVDAGVKAVVVGGSISDMAIHFLDRYKVLILRTLSKFELRRICKATGATPLVRLGTPLPEELGFANKISVEEIGSQKCVIINNDSEENKLATILVRSSTSNLLDNTERVIEDGVNAYKNLCKSNLYVAGAGSFEAYVSNQLKEFSKGINTIDQYAVEMFGEGFQVIPRIIIENSGGKDSTVIPELMKNNKDGCNFGVDIVAPGIKVSSELKVFDHLETKKWALKFCMDVVLTVLKVDQIVLSKPSGGPKAMQQGGQKPGWDNEEI